MRTEITYYAFDDTEFYDEEACREYEKLFLSSISSVIMRDEDLNPIEISGEDYRKASEAYYIFIIDADKAKVLFGYLESLVGTAQPKCEFEGGDILVYDDDGGWDDAWINLSRRIKKDNETLKTILEGVKKDG